MPRASTQEPQPTTARPARPASATISQHQPIGRQRQRQRIAQHQHRRRRLGQARQRLDQRQRLAAAPPSIACGVISFLAMARSMKPLRRRSRRRPGRPARQPSASRFSTAAFSGMAESFSSARHLVAVEAHGEHQPADLVRRQHRGGHHLVGRAAQHHDAGRVLGIVQRLGQARPVGGQGLGVRADHVAVGGDDEGRVDAEALLQVLQSPRRWSAASWVATASRKPKSLESRFAPSRNRSDRSDHTRSNTVPDGGQFAAHLALRRLVDGGEDRRARRSAGSRRTGRRRAPSAWCAGA